jgi:hypothetical protein
MTKASFEELSRRVAPLFSRVESGGFESLTEPERVLFIVWAAVGQIENGGFDQFFYNSSGNFALETVSALESVGAINKGAVVKRALALFPDSLPPRDRDARIKLLDTIAGTEDEDPFDSLNEEFYAIPENTDLLLAAYLEAHDAEIARVDASRADT